MAIAIPITLLSRDGIAPSASVTDLQTTMTFNQRDKRSWFEVTNTAGVSRTIVIDTPDTVQGLAIADVPVVIPAGATRIVGPFGNEFGSNGLSITVPGANDLQFRGYCLPV